jgi:AraC family transcriptional regulator of adaptative response/methylated-DNA-[protein]-cysteine methyltransferase
MMVKLEDINYTRIEAAIKYILQNYKKQPSLEEVASAVHLSPYHFQRIFTEWAGISPKKFSQYLTIEDLKLGLQQSKNLLEAASSVGLSSQSRIYDLFVNIEAVTPLEYRASGKGIEIEFGKHITPFGWCFVATTERGICELAFIDENEQTEIDRLKLKWNNASIRRNQNAAKGIIDRLFTPSDAKPLKLFLQGTKFQVKVWEALLKVPFGTVTSYQFLADQLQQSTATRAVASAVARNPIAYLIPCHRVIRSEGIIGEYHWGSARKATMIGWEKLKIDTK